MKTNNIISVKVEFSNPIYNYSTRFNGTLSNAQHYFINKSFNFGNDEKENFQTCINVNILN